MSPPSVGLTYDRVVIGAGLFGLYAATRWSTQGLTVAVVDADNAPMLRASYVNQARLHYGYHYPRSLTTATSSIKYYHRFKSDFAAAVNDRFQKVYAISSTGSYMSAQGFQRFCEMADIPCREVASDPWFHPDVVTAAYQTEECSFDASTLRAILLSRLDQRNVTWFLGRRVDSAAADADSYELVLDDGTRVSAAGLLNATYAGLNQILGKLDVAPFALKYELCEILLVDVEGPLKEVGLTVMDGDFFSLMPFGRTGCHSLTTVDYTPRVPGDTRHSTPVFPCQSRNPNCNPQALDHCTYCSARPTSAWRYARQRARLYLRDAHRIAYRESLFTVKTILDKSDVDDARPTLIEVHREKPWLCSALSGKVATIYDLDSVL